MTMLQGSRSLPQATSGELLTVFWAVRNARNAWCGYREQKMGHDGVRIVPAAGI
jgi:hypothetical protein